MDHSVTLARHLARLIWLLLNEPANIEEQKASLRALVASAREGAVTVAPTTVGITADAHPITASISGIGELAARLAAHRASALVVHAEATAADLLDTARLLAADADGDSAERLRASGVTTLHLEPIAAVTRSSAALDGFELVSDDALAAAVGAPRARASAPAVGAGTGGDAVTGLFSQFASAPAADTRDALLGELAVVSDHDVPGVLDRVVLAAAQAQHEGDAAGLTAIIAAVIRREALASPDAKRSFGIAMRRMVSAHGLRMIAAQLPRRPVAKEAVVLVLSRTGEEGADAVIEQLTQAQSAGDRRAYYDMLLSLRAGIPALVHMLGDSRWYVVRNAVDLLGEMQVAEAERAITALCTHDDERVRASATAALLRFDTPTARAYVQRALGSESAATRQQAVAALGMRKGAHAAGTLGRALDRERDDSVVCAIYVALGKVASPDAVERLIDAAQPAAGLFKRKAPRLRIAAVTALGEARTPAALDALRALSEDRDRDVRTAVLRALSQARAGIGVTGVFERQ